MSKNNIVQILWSGGFDSTFMLCYLARTSCVIKPYYLELNGRMTTKYEKSAIKSIYALLKKKKDIRAQILPVKFTDYYRKDLSEEILIANKQLNDEPYYVGNQYSATAAFAKTHKGICLGLQGYIDEPGPTVRLFRERGHIHYTSDGCGYFNKIDCDPLVYILFGNIRFPVIKINNLEMWDLMNQWGYSDILEHIWFCHYPIDGKPCGFCPACRTKMLFKMEWLLSPIAKKRYYVWKELDNIDKINHNHSFTELFETFCSETKRLECLHKGKEQMIIEVEKYSDYFYSLLNK